MRAPSLEPLLPLATVGMTKREEELYYREIEKERELLRKRGPMPPLPIVHTEYDDGPPPLRPLGSLSRIPEHPIRY